jgi:hypothetical protein
VTPCSSSLLLARPRDVQQDAISRQIFWSNYTATQPCVTVVHWFSHRYCTEAFFNTSYELLATSGAADVPPPPVVDFNCMKSIFKQTLDHYNAADTRCFKQVFWVCDSAFPDSQTDQVRSRIVNCRCVMQGPFRPKHMHSIWWIIDSTARHLAHHNAHCRTTISLHQE